MSKSTKMICAAQWFWRDACNHKWVAETGEPANLPALLGPTKKRLSIWLPSGTRIVCRPGIHGFKFPCTTLHFYGRDHVTGLAENKIEFFVRDLEPGEQWPEIKNIETFKLSEVKK